MSCDTGSGTIEKLDPENMGISVGILLCAPELEICLGQNTPTCQQTSQKTVGGTRAKVQSLERTWFNRGHSISQQSSIVTIPLSCTVSEIQLIDRKSRLSFTCCCMQLLPPPLYGRSGLNFVTAISCEEHIILTLSGGENISKIHLAVLTWYCSVTDGETYKTAI